jgi:hypothetical protein
VKTITPSFIQGWNEAEFIFPAHVPRSFVLSCVAPHLGHELGVRVRGRVAARAAAVRVVERERGDEEARRELAPARDRALGERAHVGGLGCMVTLTLPAAHITSGKMQVARRLPPSASRRDNKNASRERKK